MIPEHKQLPYGHRAICDLFNPKKERNGGGRTRRRGNASSVFVNMIHVLQVHLKHASKCNLHLLALHACMHFIIAGPKCEKNRRGEHAQSQGSWSSTRIGGKVVRRRPQVRVGRRRVEKISLTCCCLFGLGFSDFSFHISALCRCDGSRD